MAEADDCDGAAVLQAAAGWHRCFVVFRSAFRTVELEVKLQPAKPATCSLNVRQVRPGLQSAVAHHTTGQPHQETIGRGKKSALKTFGYHVFFSVTCVTLSFVPLSETVKLLYDFSVEKSIDR